MKFISFYKQRRILLAIYPPHLTHTLQFLDVSLFGPLSTAYSKHLTELLHQCLGFCAITKRDFFRLFWQAWQQAFTTTNILGAFTTTGLDPFDPQRVLKRFNEQEGERPSSSESSASVLKAEDWRRIRRLLSKVVTNIYEEKAKKLKNTILDLSTQNILLKIRCENLEKALINEKKRRQRGKPLLLELQSSKAGGAIFCEMAHMLRKCRNGSNSK